MRRPLLAALSAGTLVVLAGRARAQDWGPWRALGPFDFDWTAGAENPLPMADELDVAVPDGPGLDLSRTFEGRGGALLEWVPLRGEDLAESRRLDVGHVDLNAAVELPAGAPGGNADARVFLYRKYAAAEEAALALGIGSDDGVRIWWNGELVHTRLVHRVLTAGADSVSVVARAGVNHLLVEVSNQTGGWAFRMTGRSDGGAADVNAAIDAGVAFLLDQQQLDGSWASHEGYRAGYTAFAAYTLLKCGLPPEHPAVRRAMAFVDDRGGDFTYTAACELLARCAAGERDSKRVRQLVRNLAEWQESAGLLSYPLHPDGGVRANADLSNALYAALAMRAAEQAGAKVSSDFWKRIVVGTLRNREREREVVRDDGTAAVEAGFYYWPGAPVTGSMTTAGLGILAMAEQALGRKLSSKDRRELERARETGLSWLGARMHFDGNPGQDRSHHYFHVYGVERVGSLLGLRDIGGVDWYREGARYLVDAQDPSGAWKPEAELVDTCLALLFLRRATAPSSGGANKRALTRTWESEEGDVVLAAQGDTPLTLYVQRFAPEVREELTWPGERGAGLHVARVEYLAHRAGDPGEPRVVASVEADPLRAAGTERFPARVALPDNGTWSVTARVHVWASRAADGLESERVVLESRPLPIAVREVFHAVWLRYPGDRDENLALRHAVRTEASSSQSNQLPEHAVDGRPATRWHCGVTDADPWIRLVPDRAFRVRRVLLTHAWPRASHASAARPARVRITVNEDERVLEVDVDPDVLKKTEVDLGRAFRLKSLEVRVLASRDRVVGTDAVGFSEIELQGP